MAVVCRVVARAGSSPRRRGKQGRPSGGQGDGGLIPAWAGKTRTHRLTHSRLTAHPRVGGENGQQSSDEGAPSGSSPRRRGKRILPADVHLIGGLIPAWAGKTNTRLEPNRRSQAHPRVGGENRKSSERRPNRWGSSPRGRGKLAGVGLDSLDERLIPAWAGKTPRPSESPR